MKFTDNGNSYKSGVGEQVLFQFSEGVKATMLYFSYILKKEKNCLLMNFSL